jgi:ankyrin repeat protein
MVRRGLVWITSAARPLTRSEFAAVSGKGVDHDGLKQEFLSFLAVDEFESLLCGVIRVDEDKILMASSGASALLSALVKGPQNQQVPGANPGDVRCGSQDDSDSWCSLASNPHLEIAKDCVWLLKKHFADRGQEATETEESGTKKSTISSPLLSYASEHWLNHIQLWDIDVNSPTANQSSTPGDRELDFAIDFVIDHHAANEWLKHRNLNLGKERGVQPAGQYNIMAVATTLGLDIKRLGDFVTVMTIVQLASSIQIRHGISSASAVAIASAQLDNVEVLKRLGKSIPDEALELLFMTGADASLCCLADSYPELVTREWTRVITFSVDLANLQLLDKLCRDENTVASYNDVNLAFHLLHKIAELGSFLPPEPFWDRFGYLLRAASTDKTTSLHLAAASGHSLLVCKLLKDGISRDINRKDASGDTSLLGAVKNGHFDIAAQLLDANADPSLPDRSRQTPLHVASTNGSLNVIELLLSLGTAVSIDAKDGKNNTPLHLALANGHAEIAMALLSPSRDLDTSQLPHLATEETETAAETPVSELPAQVRTAEAEESTASGKTVLRFLSLNSQNSTGVTPLILAIQSGQVQVVELLLRLGAEVNVPDGSKRTPLHHAALLDAVHILCLLLQVQDAKINFEDANNATPLHVAASAGLIDNVKMLVETGADCNAADKQRRTPLGLACEMGYADVVGLLLLKCTQNNITASFLIAAQAGHVDIVQLLLDAGAAIDALNKQANSSTALHFGALGGNEALVQELIVRKALPDPKDFYGQTPLYITARCNMVDCLRLLVKARASVNVSDDFGVTPLYAAATEGHVQCVDILLGARAALKGTRSYLCPSNRRKFLEIALCNFRADVFQRILEHVRHEDWRVDVSNAALLSFLCIEQDKDPRGLNKDTVAKLRMLLENGLQHDRIIGNYGTILHYACLWDKDDVVTFLAEMGYAKPGIIHEDYGTPLQIAAEKAKVNSLKIVQTLLKAEADPLLGGGKYGTPLHAAASMPEGSGERYLDIARMIIKHAPPAVNVEVGACEYPTVLQAAVAGGTASMVLLICESGADLNVVAGTYGTPLHIAARKGYASIRAYACGHGTIPV